MKAIGRIFVAMLAFMAGTAGATFHLWRMTEIYSNADGSVQFLELGVNSNGENLLSGHTLTSTSGGATRTFTFLTDVGFDTQGRTLLIATQGFAALNLVTPDYVVPNQFFSAAGGSVNFADVDVWDYPALPTTGARSLGREGQLGVNSPMNFAGQTATLSAAAPMNFQALWWRAPADSESGWGLNITHQGDTLFATWFTYDTDGSGMWLVVSDARKMGENAYSGTMYRTTGPAFDSASFNSSQVVVTAVGLATFTFTDANNGTFSYSVGNVIQSKAITRQVYSSPMADCSAGGAAGANPSYQDLWWRSPANSESGWGVNVTHQGDILFATWFTYAANGKGMWLVMSDGRRTGPGIYTGALYRTTGPAFSVARWDASTVKVTQVGTATFTFPESANGTFRYTVDGVTQTKPITRQVYALPGTVCR
jgi:hypothetical protein